MIAMNNLGYAYKYLGDLRQSSLYFEQLLEVIPPKNTSMRADVLQNLGILYQNQARYTEAVDKLDAAVAIYKKEGNIESEAIANDFIALIYYQQNDAFNALQYNTKAIEAGEKHGLKRMLQGAYQTKSLIHQALFEYEEALEAYKRHLELKDELNDSERSVRQDLDRTKDVLKDMDNRMQLQSISEELKDAEIARLTSEKEAEREKRIAEEKVASKEAELKDAELREKDLQAKRAFDALLIQRKEADLLRKSKEIDSLDAARLAEQQKRRLAEQERALADARAAAARDSTRAAQAEASLAAKDLLAQKSRTRRLFLILLGLGVFIIAILVILAQLRKEKRKSEALLLNILPASVADELKRNGKTTPHSYPNSSIVFTDFSGFTQISEKLTPEQLVHTLDDIFGKFDEIVENNGLTRIKTIGDAYMCACGLPDADPDHAKKAVNAALDMRDFILKFNAGLPEKAPQWNIRIGVNSGQVVAGVVGIKKFAYDIWGDTVNLAARMESSGQIGKVNISEDTYNLVKNDFPTEPRGKVKAKNKGEIDMYFVERN